MKNITFLVVLLFIVSFQIQCAGPKKVSETTYTDDQTTIGKSEITLNMKAGSSFNHPTYVIWLEDIQGRYIKTLFITQYYASGIFGHQMIGDTLWMPTPGASYQPAALPYWTYKKGPITEDKFVPTPDHPFTDAYTGATPLGDLIFKTKINQKTPFRVLCEINQPWDWDKYWTNNKYPENQAYKHSAQPSMVYATTVLDSTDTYYLNPIGHGDPKGETGKMYTNLNTISSAKNIFESIYVNLEYNR